MKFVQIVFFLALIAFGSSAVVINSEDIVLKRSQRNIKSSLRHTLCDIEYGTKQILIDIGKNGSQEPSPQEVRAGLAHVFCKIDAEFGEGTVKNVILILFIIILLMVLGCIRNICF
ncbi:hypothetical protein ACFFRR_003578 [Megaselia abdita]